jgi:hypothetical protein
MKIRKKRIRSINNNFPKYLIDTDIIVGVTLDVNTDLEKIKNLGFTGDLNAGETVLPPLGGPVSIFNADGKEILDKTKPKETRYREIEWCRQQWIGGGRTKEVCDFRQVPYQRYQRETVLPPSVELTISKKDGDKIYITTTKVKLSKANEKEISHKVNLVSEIFGFAEIFDEKQVPIIKTTIKLNWDILPKGIRPWDKQKTLLKPFLDNVKDKRQKPVYDSRFEDINNLKPYFTAIGKNGFNGYVIFGFSDRNIYILESAFYGNAIYIFNEDWEKLSRKTKAEIINNDLQIERITHIGEKNNWLQKIKEILT